MTLRPPLRNYGTPEQTVALTIGAIFDQATDLAQELAQLARAEQDTTLARLATDAHGLTADLHQVGELLATMAGVPGRAP